MDKYELNADEIDLVLSALKYTTTTAFTLIQRVADDMEYVDMCALIDRLTPKPVKKEGWMIVWNDGAKTQVYDSAQEACNRYGAPPVCNGKIIKVTWEE